MAKVKIEGNASGTGTFTIAAPNSNTDRVLTLPDEAGTVLTSASSVTATQALSTVPAFMNILETSQSQTLSVNTWTKVDWDAPNVDTHSYWDATNNRYTPQVAGYYYITSRIEMNNTTQGGRAAIYKNGTRLVQSLDQGNAYGRDPFVALLVQLNGSTDYVEIWGYSSDSTLIYNGDKTCLSIYLVSTYA